MSARVCVHSDVYMRACGDAFWHTRIRECILARAQVLTVGVGSAAVSGAFTAMATSPRAMFACLGLLLDGHE